MRTKLIKHLKTVEKKLSAKKVPLIDLVTLSRETKKMFDETISYLTTKRGLIKRIKPPHNYLSLLHNGRQIIIPVNWRYLLSAPFIYSMILPAVIWHIGLEIYHQVCFRLYGIPLVNFREYFIYDRQLLSWLNIWEKLNCYYCSYVNNLIRYSSEIGGRTERYWCPIKYARRIANAHSQYQKFVGKSGRRKFRDNWEQLRDFSDLTPSPVSVFKVKQ